MELQQRGAMPSLGSLLETVKLEWFEAESNEWKEAEGEGERERENTPA